jgi:hypothetical protein
MMPEKAEQLTLELKRSAIARAFDGASRTEGWMLNNLVEQEGGGYRISGSEHMSLSEFVRRQLQTKWSFLAAEAETPGKPSQPDDCPSIERLISGNFTEDEERAALKRIDEILKGAA